MKVNISDAQKTDLILDPISAGPIKIDDCPVIRQTLHQTGNISSQVSIEPPVHRYPDQLVVIWDQASFAVSMADHLTRCDIQTILIDADLMNPRIDMLLGFDSSRRSNVPDEVNGQPANGVANGLELALTALMRRTVVPDRFPELLQKTNRPKLMALTGCYRLRDYDYYDPQILLDLFRMSRMHADVVLVCCNRFIHDSFTCLSILAADLVLIPIIAEPGTIREFNRYLDFLASQYPFDRRKVRFIATGYDSSLHLSWGMINELCDGLLAGCIPREKTTPELNRRKTIFRSNRTGKSVNEYNQLLRRLGFIKSRDDRR